MKRKRMAIKDLLITSVILIISFLLCLYIQSIFEDNSLIPSIFVLGAFLTSVLTQGYVYGIVSALISVLAVNFAFTFPYFRFDFTVMENMISGVILLAVAVITCGLTTTIKRQEQMKAESEKEKMRANLLRAISHDLRTPLTTIYGSSSALLEHYGEFSMEQNRQMLQGIKEDSQWLSQMVENLLSVTRIDGRNVKIIKNETVLDELVDSVLVKFAKRYPHQEVELDLPEDFIVIPMDAILIEQVIINLLENAVEHAKGMTKLTLRVAAKGSKAIFCVRDNGSGIEEEIIKNIFTGQIYKDHIPADGGKNSAGIGLSVCATIVKAHGGELMAANLKEGGCEFKFALEMEEVSNE
ncbi:MAG: DUF4118 domain-containing protein [Clostridiales bacterium]|nr:DUF4118 domain-containing protein [Clostridiales bacterium]